MAAACRNQQSLFYSFKREQEVFFSENNPDDVIVMASGLFSAWVWGLLIFERKHAHKWGVCSLKDMAGNEK